MGANFTLCCCHFPKHNREEKKAILCMHNTSTYKQTGLLSSESSDSNTDEESLFGPPSGRSRWENHQSRSRTADLWASSNRPSESIRRGSDRELQAFINMRDQADTATEEWEKLNYDIHTLCYARREVRYRWKKILLQLGETEVSIQIVSAPCCSLFALGDLKDTTVACDATRFYKTGYQCEVDSLLCVNQKSRFGPDQEHLGKATELLKQLLDHTSLFPPGTEHNNRYLYVMDRLVSLDSAEEFIRLAKKKYPKKEG